MLIELFVRARLELHIKRTRPVCAVGSAIKGLENLESRAIIWERVVGWGGIDLYLGKVAPMTNTEIASMSK